MPRRSHEVHAETLDAVIRISERMNLELAPVARARVHMADGEAAAEELAHLGLNAVADLGERRFESSRRRFRDDADALYFA